MKNGRCRIHGGLSLGGGASPSFKTGKYSGVLPRRLMERYEAAINDRDLLALRDEIGLLDTRINELVQRVEQGDSASLFEVLAEVFADFKKANREHDTETAIVMLSKMDNLIGRGQQDYAAWAEIQTALVLRMKLVESERKRLVELQTMISAENALGMVQAIQESIQRHVTIVLADQPEKARAILAGIVNDIRGFIAGNTRNRSGAGQPRIESAPPE